MEKARECFQKEGYEVRKSMLKLFYRIGGWTTIADLMLGTIDEHETIRQLSCDYIKNWQIKAVRLFISPEKEAIERAKRIFNAAYEIHEVKQYFETNPLKELAPYFK